jgi:hypothetical protein
VGFLVEKVTQAGLLRVLRLPLPVIIPSATPYSLTILSPMLYSLDTDVVMQAIAAAATTTKLHAITAQYIIQ